MKISIIVPSYNEEKTLQIIINKLLKLRIKAKKEIIIVDDGSTDNTKKILQSFSSNKFVKIIRNKKNLGKGASIKKALKISSGDIIVIQDADLEYNPDDINNLLQPFKNKSIKVVYGSRVLLKKNPISHWTFNMGGKFITYITNVLYKTNISDEPTGYKAFKKEIFRNIKINSRRFEFCPEITAKISKANIKIVEVPISYNPRQISEKKIKWHDGILAIYYLLKYRLLD